MKAVLTRSYPFSASFERDEKIHGYNFKLEISVVWVSEQTEFRLDQKVQASLIDQIHSRDLGLDVPFLANQPISETSLLNTFFEILKKELPDLQILGFALVRDDRTVFSLIIP